MWNEKSEFDETKDKTQFRDYDAACDRVKNFYKEQHGMLHSSTMLFTHWPIVVEKQTVEFNIKARVNFKTKRRARMSVWEAMEMLNTLIDESDPDVRLHFPLLPFVAWRKAGIIRRVSLRSNTYYKQLKLSDEMVNPTGCRLVIRRRVGSFGPWYDVGHRSRSRSREVVAFVWFRGSMGCRWCTYSLILEFSARCNWRMLHFQDTFGI